MVITMSHAWAERSHRHPWPFQQFHFPPSSWSSSTSSCVSCSLKLSSKLPYALSLRRWGLMTRKSPSQVMSPRTWSSQRRTSSSIRSPWPSNGSPSNGSPKTWTKTTPPGQVLLNTYWGQVDHSEWEGLSSGPSSSSMSQDRTCQPVVDRDKSHDRTGQPVVEGHEFHWWN